MNKKGFVFSLTAVYYAAVVLLFLSLVFFSVDYYSTIGSQEKGYSRNIVELERSLTSGYYWCSIYMSYDAEDSDLDEPSELNIKKYCEDYAR